MVIRNLFVKGSTSNRQTYFNQTHSHTTSCLTAMPCICFNRVLFVIVGEHAKYRSVTRRATRFCNKLESLGNGFEQFSRIDLLEAARCVRIARKALIIPQPGEPIDFYDCRHDCDSFEISSVILSRVFYNCYKIYSNNLQLIDTSGLADTSLESFSQSIQLDGLENEHSDDSYEEPLNLVIRK